VATGCDRSSDAAAHSARRTGWLAREQCGEVCVGRVGEVDVEQHVVP
jgi:hypothetical protein